MIIDSFGAAAVITNSMTFRTVSESNASLQRESPPNPPHRNLPVPRYFCRESRDFDFSSSVLFFFHLFTLITINLSCFFLYYANLITISLFTPSCCVNCVTSLNNDISSRVFIKFSCCLISSNMNISIGIFGMIEEVF